MPIIFFLFLRITLKVWAKNRDIDFKEYSYKTNDILKRTKFSFKLYLIILLPTLLIAIANILTLIRLFNCLDDLDYNLIQVIISIIFALFLFIIQFICYKKIVNYEYYDSICEKYNIVNEKKAFEVFSIIEMIYFNFSVIIFLINII